MQADERKVDVHALARALAQELRGWSYGHGEGHDRMAVIAHEGGAEVVLYAPNYPPSAVGRVEIKGRYSAPVNSYSGYDAPHYYGILAHNEKAPSMSVDASRPIGAIAAEFSRRVEIEIIALWNVVERRRTAELVDHDNGDRVMERILAAAPKGHRYTHSREIEGSVSGWGDDSWRGRVTVNPRGYGVDLDMHRVPYEVAVKLVALLAELTTEAHGEICETDPCERCQAQAVAK